MVADLDLVEMFVFSQHSGRRCKADWVREWFVQL